MKQGTRSSTKLAVNGKVAPPSPARLLRVAKTEIARLTSALDEIAKEEHWDAESLRDHARDALFGPGPLDYEREAEELRHGVEQLIAEKGETVHELMAFDADELAVKASDLLDLLDRVDARDSLAFLEKQEVQMKQGTQRVRKPAVSRGGPPPIVTAIYRSLLREAREVEKQDWERSGGVPNVERDRYVQATRDAATHVLQVWSRST